MFVSDHTNPTPVEEIIKHDLTCYSSLEGIQDTFSTSRIFDEPNLSSEELSYSRSLLDRENTTFSEPSYSIPESESILFYSGSSTLSETEDGGQINKIYPEIIPNIEIENSSILENSSPDDVWENASRELFDDLTSSFEQEIPKIFSSNQDGDPELNFGSIIQFSGMNIKDGIFIFFIHETHFQKLSLIKLFFR